MDDLENQFTVAIKGVGASLGCPSCGTDDAWSKPQFSLLVDSTQLPKQRVTQKDGVHVMGAICGGCGFVRLHSAEYLGVLDEARGLID